jgi:ceramide glucosyltransferase
VNLETLFVLAPAAIALLAYLTMQAIFATALSRHRARRVPPREACARAPGVTVLKPLAGTDDDLEANLESFAHLDYPTYELLFGVASTADPAYAVAERFVARHPGVRARVVVTDPDAAVNPKVAQLIALESRAAGEVVVISDSNVRVHPDYLWSLVRELEEPGTGLVTSVIAGTGEETLGAALENLQLGGVVTPGIVSCQVMSGVLGTRPLTVGKSMAMRRRDLARLGGFRPLGGVLAEDHVLGRTFREAGLAIRTSLDAVENHNVRGGLARTIERHTRWAKMRRAISPVGFLFEPLLSPLSVAAATLAVHPTRVVAVAVAVAAVVQTLVGFAATRMLRGRALAWYYAPLEVVRTFVAFACWARAFASRRIVWRGHPFLLGADSAIHPAEPTRFRGLFTRT